MYKMYMVRCIFTSVYLDDQNFCIKQELMPLMFFILRCENQKMNLKNVYECLTFSNFFIDSDFCHTYLHTLYMFVRL